MSLTFAVLSWSCTYLSVCVSSYGCLSLCVVQSTIMVYQALAEYWINAKEQQYAMDIEIQVEGRSGLVPAPFRINNENAYQTRTTKVGIHWQIMNCIQCWWQRMVKLCRRS